MFGVCYLLDFAYYYPNQWFFGDYVNNHCSFHVENISCSNLGPLVIEEVYYIIDMVPFLVMMILHRKSFKLPTAHHRSTSLGLDSSTRGNSVLHMDHRFEESTNKSTRSHMHSKVLGEDLIKMRLRFELESEFMISLEHADI